MATSERLYALIANEEDARACQDISAAACREVPGNFFILLLTSILTKLGDNLSSPKTVLTWLMVSIQAPPALLALIVPIRESGSMLPQLAIGQAVRHRPRRKPIWILGSLLQFLSLAAMGLVALLWRGAPAAWALLGLLVLFSLARGLCSVSAKDILGKTVPKRRRGRLTGLSAGLSGLLASVLGLWLLFLDSSAHGTRFFALLIMSAASLWLLAALLFLRLSEEPGETGGGGNALREALARLALLRSDATFRRFVIARALLISTALAAPYYVVLARQQLGEGLGLLGSFVIAGGLAATLGAPAWGLLADRSSRQVLLIGALMASGMSLALFLIVSFLPALVGLGWLYQVAFFLLALAHAGVRIGRKTYLVDMSGGVKRVDYVAVSNTLIGLILLGVGLVGSALSFLAPETLVLLYALLGFTGVWVGRGLPEV